jgi:UDP-N-acetylglucosamine 2-epimerase (non-hydrolysing)
MPEEINRCLTDQIADFLFATEESAVDNLRREGVRPEKIHFVGNVMIDTLVRYRERADRSRILEVLGVRPGMYAALTLHRPSTVDDPEALRRVLGALARIQTEMPIVFPVHPRTRGCFDALKGCWSGLPGLRPIEPLPYVDFVQLMAKARCVLTDSGGVQEETTALGVPCLTLRPGTERPSTIAQGTNRVVGLDPARICAAWEDLRRGEWPRGRLPELWDGKAAERIIKVLVEPAGAGQGDV